MQYAANSQKNQQKPKREKATECPTSCGPRCAMTCRGDGSGEINPSPRSMSYWNAISSRATGPQLTKQGPAGPTPWKRETFYRTIRLNSFCLKSGHADYNGKNALKRRAVAVRPDWTKLKYSATLPISYFYDFYLTNSSWLALFANIINLLQEMHDNTLG